MLKKTSHFRLLGYNNSGDSLVYLLRGLVIYNINP